MAQLIAGQADALAPRASLPGRRLHKDFETASAADLKKVGLYNYAMHWSTHILCMAWAFDDDAPQIWFPGQPYPAEVAAHEQAGGIVLAYNAPFEWAIHNFVLPRQAEVRALTINQMNCVMARANAMALPPKLENVAPALNLKVRKDLEGHRLMMQMCKPKPLPRGVTERRRDEQGHEIYDWWREPAQLQRLGEYCKQDVATEQAVDKLLYELSPQEQIIWRLDHEINWRGLPLDIALAERITRIVDVAHAALDEKMRKLTGGFVPRAGNAPKLTEFIEARGYACPDGIGKDEVLKLLARDDLDDVCREALELRQMAAKSSVAKFDRMLTAVSADGWVRGMFAYHAATTGRWGGRTVQVQNLVRWPKWFKMEDADRIIKAIMHFDADQAYAWIEFFYDSVLTILPYLLRPTIRADRGHTLISADASSIEARGLGWQAGEEWLLNAFRDLDAGTGPGIYEMQASAITGKPVTEIDEDERQSMGKVPVLACGYGGGVGAFQNMAKVYGVKISDAKADAIKVAWREKNPNIVNYWYALERAAMAAVRTPGRKFSAGAEGRETVFLCNATCLRAKLPSGRVLTYMYPSIKERETPWGELKDAVHFWAWDSEKNRWAEDHTYGGKLSENTTQAICRDLLANAMLRLRKYGFTIIAHVHDEAVAHVPLNDPRLTKEAFAREAGTLPAWAHGLPIVFKAVAVTRYSK